MGLTLGLDTSNYTSSLAFFDTEKKEIFGQRRLLPVKEGEKGIRQNDAVFHHTQAMPVLFEKALEGRKPITLSAIGVSEKPTEMKGSYMPCFSVGMTIASCIGSLTGKKVYRNTHQQNHIAAVAYGANRMDLLEKEFIAFHLSGGTTEAVLCSPNPESVFSCRLLSSSSDLKAGQAIDRIGVLLGLSFPAGAALDSLSQESQREFHPRPFLRDGCPSLSGIQNQCEKMMANGECRADIAKFCIDSVCAAVLAMAKDLRKKMPDLPMIFSGGVTANTQMRRLLSAEVGGIFAPAEFSTDHAIGSAILTALKDGIPLSEIK